MRALSALLLCLIAPAVLAGDKEAGPRRPFRVGERFVEHRRFVSRLAITVTDNRGPRKFERDSERLMQRSTRVLAVKAGAIRVLEARYEAFFKGDPEAGKAEKAASPILGKSYRIERGETPKITRVDGAEPERFERLDLEEAEASRPRAAVLIAAMPAPPMKPGQAFDVPEGEARRLLAIVYDDFKFSRRRLVFKERDGEALVFDFEAAGAVTRTKDSYRFRLQARGAVRVGPGRALRVELEGTADVEEKRMGRTTLGESRFTVLETVAPAPKKP